MKSATSKDASLTATAKAPSGLDPQESSLVKAPVSRAKADVETKSAAPPVIETYGTLMMGANSVSWSLPGAKVFLGTGELGTPLVSELFDLPQAIGANVD